MEFHRGVSERSLSGYEEELERMKEVRRERMGEFVGAARAEVQQLHEELLDDTEEEDPYSSSSYPGDGSGGDEEEETLKLLESRLFQLRELLNQKNSGGLLGMVKKYFLICEEEKELFASSQDQSRLLGRGGRDAGRLLREEKMRKRVKRDKPKVCVVVFALYFFSFHFSSFLVILSWSGLNFGTDAPNSNSHR